MSSDNGISSVIPRICWRQAGRIFDRSWASWVSFLRRPWQLRQGEQARRPDQGLGGICYYSMS
jgi:hypothetical protein